MGRPQILERFFRIRFCNNLLEAWAVHIVHTHIAQKKRERNLAKSSVRPKKCHFGYRWKIKYIRAKQTWMSDEYL
jgi:hypothetical protein